MDVQTDKIILEGGLAAPAKVEDLYTPCSVISTLEIDLTEM